MASSENRSIRRAVVYGISVRTIPPCLRQFQRRPTWLVNKREKECLGISSILATVTCWRNKKSEKSDVQTSFKNSNSYRQEMKYLILLIINSLLSSKDISLMKSVFLILSLFLLKYLLLEGRNWYLFEKLNAKKNEHGDNLQIRYQVVGTPI